MPAKKKFSAKKTIRFILLIGAIICAILIFKMLIKKVFVKEQTLYVASTTNEVTLYDKDLKKINKVYRGTKIKGKMNKTIGQNNEYILINYNNKDNYIHKDNLVTDIKDIVVEKKVYVRTPSNLLTSPTDITIVANLPKETELEIIEFDNVDSNGNVHMYKVKCNSKEGYVYAKYTVLTLDEAKETHNVEKHSKIKNLYGGGDVKTLDFFPVEKVNFEENSMPKVVYSLYLNDTKKVISNIEEYIKFAKETKINAFVVDIKDNGAIGYESDVMKQYSKTSYKYANNTVQEYKKAIDRLKEEGFYIIGRITTFKDDYYVKDNPDKAIKGTSTNEPYKIGNSYWPTAYSRDVWYYNVSLALEAIEKFGFNEINFDYVRFPDRAGNLEKNNIIDFNNTYNEDKVQAIQNFLRYATDAIHEKKVYVSVDVFGESSNNYYTTAYGQYWPAISNVVDVISAMPYPDHFANNSYGINKPWNHPYELLSAWSKEVLKRQADTTSPAIVRTWVQAYNVQSWVDKNGIDYNAEEIKLQVKALFENNLTGGYITWHSGSNLEKYKMQQDAFKIDYLNLKGD